MNRDMIEILLVEDNPTDAELIVRELQKHRVTNGIFHARDGQEALDFLYAKGEYHGKTTSPDSTKLILLDIQMPRVNGIEVLEQIKADPVKRSIPVVILTSSNQSADISACYALGANSYIVKPLSFERFSDAVKNIGYYWLLLNKRKI